MELNINAVYRALSIADLYNPNNGERFEEDFDALVNEITERFVSKHELSANCQHVKYIYNVRERIMMVNRDLPEDPALETFVYRMITVRHRLGYFPKASGLLFDGLENQGAMSEQDVCAYIAYLFIVIPFEDFFDSLNNLGSMFAFDGTFNSFAFNTVAKVSADVYDIRPCDAQNRFNLLLNAVAWKVFYQERYELGRLDVVGDDALVIVDLLDRFNLFVSTARNRKEVDAVNCEKAIFGVSRPMTMSTIMDVACAAGYAKKMPKDFTESLKASLNGKSYVKPVALGSCIAFENESEFPEVLKNLTASMRENYQKNGGRK